MFDIFMYAINAVMPIIMLIVLGYILKQIGFLDANFVKRGNKLVFRVGLPALLFYTIYNVEDLGAFNWSTVWFSIGAVLLIFVLGLIVVRLFVKDRKRKGVVLQCIFRSNYAIIGIPLAEALGGPEGIALVAVLSAFVVPLFNVLAVIALSLFTNEGGKIDIKSVLKKIVTNPLILGTVAGLVALLIRSLLPVGADGLPVFYIYRDLKFVYKAVENLSKLATPLALIVLGGQFVFSAAGKMLKEIIIGVSWRTLLSPAVGIGLALLLTHLGVVNFGPAEFTVFVALFGTPVAVSSAVMAGEMGCDDQLAGQYVVWTSVCSMFTIFAIVFVLRLTNLL